MVRERFEVLGPVQGKARARTVNGHSYTPQNTVLYENWIKQCFTEQCKHRWFNKEPLNMVIWAMFPITKSTSKKDKKLMAEWKIHPTKKPDADNIAKVICDALNGVAYGDDTQVINLSVKKRYTDKEPKVIVYIEEMSVKEE